MNKNTIYKVAVLVAWCVAVLLAMVMASSCSSDDGAGEEQMYTSDPVRVVLKVEAAKQGDLNNSTRAFTDQNATKGEFMNTLCVYMVNADNKIVKVIKPNLTANVDARKGNLEEYISDEFEVPQGTYKLYAFANWGDTEMKDVVGMTEESTFTIPDNAKVITNPASKINLTGNDKVFIPMSGDTTGVQITKFDLNHTKQLEVGLDRLVSKVRFSIEGNKGINPDFIITNIKISGWTKNVALMNGSTVTGENPVVTDDGFSYTSDGISSKDGMKDYLEFYVNETLAEHPLTVELSGTMSGLAATYTAKTDRNEIPRNHIFPITVVSGSSFGLTVETQYAPIGVVMDWVTAQPDGSFDVTIPEGALFKITPTLRADVESKKFTWAEIAGTHLDFSYKVTDGVLEGYFTAQPGKSQTFDLTALWRLNGKSNDYSRTCQVKITTKPLEDFFKARSRAAAAKHKSSPMLFIGNNGVLPWNK